MNKNDDLEYDFGKNIFCIVNNWIRENLRFFVSFVLSASGLCIKSVYTLQ